MPDNPTKRRVCLVTPGHLSTNPRLVKEADALTAAGYQISIVAARFIPWADEADSEFSNRPWDIHKVAFGPMAGKLRYLAQGLRRRVCLLLYKLFDRCAERAFHPAIVALAHAACNTPAVLYIAHNLAALPAAVKAAKLHGAKLGFDAEDFHSGELPETPENALTIRLTRAIERRYLPLCDYLTAASPGIARAYASSYGVKTPVVVLNVFPKSDAPAKMSDMGSAKPSPSLYWFSQTIGPNRGLEVAIEAIGRSHSRPAFYLRGNPSPGYRDRLMALAAKSGIADRVRFLSPALPGEMVMLASEYDIGLAAELSSTLNHDICLSNKIFTYLLAGIPALASDTSAQSEIALAIPGAVFIYPQHDSLVLAAKMDDLLRSPKALANARQATWKFGQQRFNWDSEQRMFLNVIELVLA